MRLFEFSDPLLTAIENKIRTKDRLSLDDGILLWTIGIRHGRPRR